MIEKDVFITRGNIEILNRKKIALFASKDTPLSLYKSIEDIFSALRNMELTLAGGWQAPAEKKMFKMAETDDKANYIYYFAKNLNDANFTKKEEQLIDADKLLIIAPNLKEKRITKSLVTARDELLFKQNNKILFFYISEGGRLEGYLNQLDTKKYQLYLLDHPLNRHRFSKDIIALNHDNIAMLAL